MCAQPSCFRLKCNTQDISTPTCYSDKGQWHSIVKQGIGTMSKAISNGTFVMLPTGN